MGPGEERSLLREPREQGTDRTRAPWGWGEGRFAALVPRFLGLEVRAELRLKAVGSRTAPAPGPQTGVLTPSTDRTWPSRMTEETYLLYSSPLTLGQSPLKTLTAAFR